MNNMLTALMDNQQHSKMDGLCKQRDRNPKKEEENDRDKNHCNRNKECH